MLSPSIADKNPDPVLQVRGFDFAFEKNVVFSNVSFALHRGEIMYVAGQNGAGKSTLLKALLRLHEHGKARGEVTVAGRPLESYSQAGLARHISYVPQAGGWIPPFSAAHFAELSYFSRRSAGLKADDGKTGAPASKKAALKAVEKALNLTGIAHLAERPLRTLSGGERQLAYVAAALAQEAEIMLLDEPTAFLDPRRTAGMNALLARLNREENLAMICVTHDLNQMLASGGKALLLHTGQQYYYGPASGLADGKTLSRLFMHEFTMLIHPKTGNPALLD